MSATPTAAHPEVTALYTAHQGWLQGWLRRRLGNAWEAADLAQDTFVRLLATPAGRADLQTAPLREPRAYLATVARRLLINHLRRQSLEQAYLEALAALPEAQTPSPEQQLVILQSLQELDAMLGSLPPKVRSVFVLSQVEGLTYAAIAEELGIGLRSVKRYMAQAMAECILLAP
ncbi:sigma-70 family RNA polymerase sigma factor [Comamonas sp. CMM01]|uniref:sigma-70 family RNA polymerase sigma factor n=1 Tax=Comamonas sp. CMM01 TaxID=2769280 RepID=UPI00177BCAE8|nr:sigma-70 family RNA polymerase sigma factor [Comamonas sp. CMM01]MBD9531040.1 sigma-70 family RNA polymerase sigma factor [Comamonas sp. CMM01]